MSWASLSRTNRLQFFASCAFLAFALAILGPPSVRFVLNPNVFAAAKPGPGWLTPLGLFLASFGIMLRRMSRFDAQVLPARYRRLVNSVPFTAVALAVLTAGVFWVGLRL